MRLVFWAHDLERKLMAPKIGGHDEFIINLPPRPFRLRTVSIAGTHASMWLSPQNRIDGSSALPTFIPIGQPCGLPSHFLNGISGLLALSRARTSGLTRCSNPCR